MLAADLNFLSVIQSLRIPFFDSFFLIITRFGEELILLPLICILYWILNKRLAVYLSISFLLAAVVNSLLKITFLVPRPWLRNADIIPVEGSVSSATGYSFPSGHTANAVSIYGAAAQRLPRRDPLKIVLWLLVLLIAFSRMYLGVHTPLDVGVSFLIGLGLLSINRKIASALDERENADRALFIGWFVFIAAAIIYTLVKPHPENADPALLKNSMETYGIASGALTGWFWDRKSFQFQQIGINWLALPVGIIGFGCALAIRILTKNPLNALLGLTFGTFIRYGLIGLWITGLYPFLLTLLFQRKRSKENV